MRNEVLENIISFSAGADKARDAVERLYRIFGSYNAILEASNTDIRELSGISASSAELVSMIPDIARYIYNERIKGVYDLSNCFLASDYLKMTYLGQHNELMYVLALDDDGKLIKRTLVQEGTVDETSVYIRKVMECAILTDACAIVISHNHPGGTLDVSLADFQCTKHVSSVASDYGIAVLDHIIIADGKAHSMALMAEMPKQVCALSEKVQRLISNWTPCDEPDD